MRTILRLVLSATCVLTQAPAQDHPFPLSGRTSSSGSSVMGGFGMTSINGESYYLVSIQPDLAFGKFGVGLDIDFRFRSTDGVMKLRTEDWDQPYDYLRMIRYVRYGLKGDPIYARLGVLDYARLGHGFIMYYYRNNASYESRKVGIELDLDFHRFGVETIWSDVQGSALTGIRVYFRPLVSTSLEKIPVIGGLEVGATAAADFHPDANKTWGDEQGLIAAAVDHGAMVITGADVGLPLVSAASFRSHLYVDVAAISGYGRGSAAGIDAEFSGLGPFTVGGKYERRWAGERFLPAYFDGLYERQRYSPDTTVFMSKAEALRHASGIDGYYGELIVSVLQTLHVFGGYQAPAGVPNQGRLHLECFTDEVLPAIMLSAGYDRSNIGKVFKLDQNSIAYAEVGYKMVPWFVVSLRYIWTFVELRGPDGQLMGYADQRRVEPKVGFVVRF